MTCERTGRCEHVLGTVGPNEQSRECGYHCFQDVDGPSPQPASGTSPRLQRRGADPSAGHRCSGAVEDHLGSGQVFSASPFAAHYACAGQRSEQVAGHRGDQQAHDSAVSARMDAVSEEEPRKEMSPIEGERIGAMGMPNSRLPAGVGLAELLTLHLLSPTVSKDEL